MSTIHSKKVLEPWNMPKTNKKKTLAGEPGKGGKAQKVAYGRPELAGKYQLS